MPAKPREIDPSLVEQWARLRSEAAERDGAARGGGPDPDVDLLGAIAWRSGFPEPAPFDPVLRELINRAHAERFTWREIASAVGESPDKAGATRVQSRQTRRNSAA